MLLIAMLDAVYVGTIDKQGVVSFQLKAAFRAHFDINLNSIRPLEDTKEPIATSSPTSLFVKSNHP